jgi:hypothetical protein
VCAQQADRRLRARGADGVATRIGSGKYSSRPAQFSRRSGTVTTQTIPRRYGHFGRAEAALTFCAVFGYCRRSALAYHRRARSCNCSALLRSGHALATESGRFGHAVRGRAGVSHNAPAGGRCFNRRRARSTPNTRLSPSMVRAAHRSDNASTRYWRKATGHGLTPKRDAP